MSDATTLDKPVAQTLAAQMTQQVNDFMAAQSGDTRQILMQAMERLLNSNFGGSAKQVGDAITSFILPNAEGRQIDISDVLANGPVVLSFYRGGWCPFCNLEFKALTDLLPDLGNYGATLIGISPQTPDASSDTVQRHKLDFEVLSDEGNQVIREFGLLMEVDESVRPLYGQWGIDLEASNGDSSWQLPIPATYVIDSNGIIRAAYVNKDYTKRMEPVDIIAALAKL